MLIFDRIMPLSTIFIIIIIMLSLTVSFYVNTSIQREFAMTSRLLAPIKIQDPRDTNTLRQQRKRLQRGIRVSLGWFEYDPVVWMLFLCHCLRFLIFVLCFVGLLVFVFSKWEC